MIHSIENSTYRVSASETGAELCSFIDKRDGHEYIWQGNSVWNGHSPLLFPIVGKLRDDIYTLGGAEYVMPKHGFAKRSAFALESHSAEEMTFLLTDSDATRANYPFSFELRVSYRFTEKGFIMEHRVKNTGDGTMYFSIGAHPGFNCDMGDKLVMDLPETAGAYQFNAEFLRKKETLPVFDNSTDFEITPTVFDNDALVFDDLCSPGCTLVRANGRNVHVDFGGAPCLGIWAKPAQPYVCIEPWYGIDDICDADHDIARKHRICALNSGEEFVFPVTIQEV